MNKFFIELDYGMQRDYTFRGITYDVYANDSGILLPLHILSMMISVSEKNILAMVKDLEKKLVLKKKQHYYYQVDSVDDSESYTYLFNRAGLVILSKYMSHYISIDHELMNNPDELFVDFLVNTENMTIFASDSDKEIHDGVYQIEDKIFVKKDLVGDMLLYTIQDYFRDPDMFKEEELQSDQILEDVQILYKDEEPYFDIQALMDKLQKRIKSGSLVSLFEGFPY